MHSGGPLCYALAGAIFALSTSSATAAEPTLRYGWNVGDRLVYERQTAVTGFAADAQRVVYADQVQLWCLARQDDRWLVLLDEQPSDGRTTSALRGVFFYVDQQGTRTVPPECERRLPALDAALRLVPPLGAALATGPEWLGPTDHYGRQWRFKRSGPDPDRGGALRLDFTVEDPTGGDALLGITCQGRLWLDPNQQLVVALETETRDTRRQQVRGDAVALRHRLQLAPDWCALRTAEADRLRLAWRSEDGLLDTLLTQPANAAATRAALQRLWTETMRDLDARAGAPVRALAAARLAALPAELPGLKARAALAQRWLGQQARTWSLIDAAGQLVRSEDVRRGDVVECFWSVADEPSVRTLLALERRWRGPEPPPAQTFLGLNMDADLAVARAVTAAGAGRALGAATTGGPPAPASARRLPAEPLVASDPLPALPICRLLDAQGVVRRVWCGWPAPPFPSARDSARGGQ
jgi:hypothetical protein